MKQALAVLVALISLTAGGRIWAAESPVPLSPVPLSPVPLPSMPLAGSTLSAIAYVPWRPGLPGGGALARLMLQAYLRADGGAVVRVWNPNRDAYTAPVERHWSLSGDKLCIDLPTGSLCAEVHVWGPRIAGIGTHPYAMLDGDLKPGNMISGSR